jgi:hypothetical protein
MSERTSVRTTFGPLVATSLDTVAKAFHTNVVASLG